MTPEAIAQGGTFGLILGLIAAVIVLFRAHMESDKDVKDQRDKAQATMSRALDIGENAVEENKKLTAAIETRNRIEEDRLRERNHPR